MSGATGSWLASNFGYVTPQDRERWDQQRQRNKPEVGVLRSALSAGVNSLVDFQQQQLAATHRVAAQEAFEETHHKTTTERSTGRGRTVVSVDYSPKTGYSQLENAQSEMEYE